MVTSFVNRIEHEWHCEQEAIAWLHDRYNGTVKLDARCPSLFKPFFKLCGDEAEWNRVTLVCLPKELPNSRSPDKKKLASILRSFQYLKLVIVVGCNAQFGDDVHLDVLDLKTDLREAGIEITEIVF